jgi:hypothetical protein
MRNWLAAIVADDARSANNSNCSPMRFSASPRAQYLDADPPAQGVKIARRNTPTHLI